MEGSHLSLVVVFQFGYFGLGPMLPLVLATGDVFDFGLEVHIFSPNEPVVFAFLQLGLIREDPLENLDPALPEHQFKLVLLHLESELVVEGDVDGVAELHCRHIARHNLVLEAGRVGEAGVDGNA